MNIEKEFIQKISSSYPGSEHVIYSLLESNSLNQLSMQRYLIRAEYKEVMSKGKSVQKMLVYSDLAEKFCMSPSKVRYILFDY